MRNDVVQAADARRVNYVGGFHSRRAARRDKLKTQVPSDHEQSGVAAWNVHTWGLCLPGVIRLLPLRRRFTRLYADLHKPVYRYVLGILTADSEAEEVMQEAFLALYKEMREGREIEDPKPWVFRVAHNLAIDRIRKRDRASQHDADVWWKSEDVDDNQGSGLDNDIYRAQQRRRVRTAMGKLAPQQRRCLELRAEGLTYRQIAASLGLAVSSVQNHLARGIKRIQEELHR